MKKSIIFALLSIFILNTTTAQVAIGIKSGVNFATVNTTEIIDQAAPDFQYAPGFLLGAVAEINFGEYFALQPEINWVQKGFTWDESIGVPIGNVDIPLGAEATFRTNYFEIPLLAKLKVGNDLVQAYAVVGPSFGIASNAKIITKPRLLFSFDPIKTNVNLSSINYERFDFGATGGLGVQFNLGSTKVFADARYTHGFTELYDFPVVNEKILNRGIALSAGVMFNLQAPPSKTKRPGKSRPTMRQ